MVYVDIIPYFIVLCSMMSCHLVSAEAMFPPDGGGTTMRRTFYDSSIADNPEASLIDENHRETKVQPPESSGRENARKGNEKNVCYNVTFNSASSVQNIKMYRVLLPNGKVYSCCGCNRNERLVEDCVRGKQWTRICAPCGPGEYMDMDAHHERQCKKYPTPPNSAPNVPTPGGVNSSFKTTDLSNTATTTTPNDTTASFTETAVARNESSTINQVTKIGQDGTSQSIYGWLVLIVIPVVALVVICCNKKLQRTLANYFTCNSESRSNYADDMLEKSPPLDESENDHIQSLIPSRGSHSPAQNKEEVEHGEDEDLEASMDSLTPLKRETSNKARNRSNSSRSYCESTMNKIKRRWSSSSRRSNPLDEEETCVYPQLPSSKDTPSERLSFVNENFQKSVPSASDRVDPLHDEAKTCGSHSSASSSPSRLLSNVTQNKSDLLTNQHTSSKQNNSKAQHDASPTLHIAKTRSSSVPKRTEMTNGRTDPCSTVERCKETTKSAAPDYPHVVFNQKDPSPATSNAPGMATDDLANDPQRKLTKTKEEKISCCTNFFRTALELVILSKDRSAFGEKFNIHLPSYPANATEREKLAVLIEEGFKQGKCYAKDVVDFTKESDLNYIYHGLLAALHSEGCFEV